MKIVNIFKVMMLVAVVSLAVVNVSAQTAGTKAVGGHLVIGTGDSFTNIGLGAKFQYNVTDPIRLEGAFTYFLKKDDMSMWDISVNGHWMFPVADNFVLYPIAGLSVMGWKISVPDITIPGMGVIEGGSASDNDFGVNIGGGAEYMLNDNLSLVGELKYRVADYDRALITFGVNYKF